MLTFLTFLVILIVSWAFWREGVLTAVCTTVNVVLAGLVAFSLWEPLADAAEEMVTGTPLAGLEDACCLFLLFSVTLGVLRVVTNNLASRQVEHHAVVQQFGAVLCALVTGYLLSGFLLCMMQTLPLPERFLGFQPGIEEVQGARRVRPPDRAWLTLMHWASVGPLCWGQVTPFDPDGSFELRYARLRRVREGEGK